MPSTKSSIYKSSSSVEGSLTVNSSSFATARVCISQLQYYQEDNQNYSPYSSILVNSLLQNLLCLLNRTHLQTPVTSYTNIFVDLWVLKPLFIFFHANRPFRAYRITRCAATAVFFAREKSRYFIILLHLFYLFFSSTTAIPQTRGDVWLTAR